MQIRRLKNKRLVKYFSVACAAALLATAPSFSSSAEEVGPGFSVIPAPVGPGYSAPSSGSASDFYYKPLPSSVVSAADTYTYDEMVQDIHVLEKTYGRHMEVEVVGKSADNRDIYDIIVGNPKAGKHLMVQGSIHGREHITSLLVMKQMEYLLAYYDTGTYNDQPISSLFDRVAVHFLPMLNPDGVSISQQGEGGIRSQDLLAVVRNSYQYDLADGRTAAPYDQYLTVWKSNARGVDLNHNFNVGWDSLNGAMTHTSFTDYKGTSPLSEPESSVLADLAGRYPFRALINYHAQGQVIYWDTQNNRQRDASLRLAQAIAATNGYQIMSSQGRGGAKDWMQSKEGAIPSVTVEVGKTPCPIPVSEFPLIWEQNRSGVITAMDFVNRN